MIVLIDYCHKWVTFYTNINGHSVMDWWVFVGIYINSKNFWFFFSLDTKYSLFDWHIEEHWLKCYFSFNINMKHCNSRVKTLYRETVGTNSFSYGINHLCEHEMNCAMHIEYLLLWNLVTKWTHTNINVILCFERRGWAMKFWTLKTQMRAHIVITFINNLNGFDGQTWVYLMDGTANDSTRKFYNIGFDILRWA